jgi:hypothetical protein
MQYMQYTKQKSLLSTSFGFIRIITTVTVTTVIALTTETTEFLANN